MKAQLNTTKNLLAKSLLNDFPYITNFLSEEIVALQASSHVVHKMMNIIQHLPNFSKISKMKFNVIIFVFM